MRQRSVKDKLHKPGILTVRDLLTEGKVSELVSEVSDHSEDIEDLMFIMICKDGKRVFRSTMGVDRTISTLDRAKFGAMLSLYDEG